MPTQYVARRAASTPNATSKATAAPIYVDSDDNSLKIIPGGAGSTTEVQIPTASIAFGFDDDISLEFGSDDDSVLRHKSASLLANTALTDVLIGTPVTQALAANSFVISNTTASGDVMIAANRGGASEEYLFADSSAGTLTLTGPGGIVNFEPVVGFALTLRSYGVLVDSKS